MWQAARLGFHPVTVKPKILVNGVEENEKGRNNENERNEGKRDKKIANTGTENDVAMEPK